MTGKKVAFQLNPIGTIRRNGDQIQIEITRTLPACAEAT